MSRFAAAARKYLPDLAFLGVGFGAGSGVFWYLDRYRWGPPEWAQSVPPARWAHDGLFATRDWCAPRWERATSWLLGESKTPKLQPYNFKEQAAAVTELAAQKTPEGDQAACERLGEMAGLAMMAAAGIGPLAESLAENPGDLRNSGLCAAASALHRDGHLDGLPYLGLLSMLSLDEENAKVLLTDCGTLGTVLKLLAAVGAAPGEAGGDVQLAGGPDAAFTQVSAIRVLAALNRSDENLQRVHADPPQRSWAQWLLRRQPVPHVDAQDVVSALISQGQLPTIVAAFRDRSDDTAGLLLQAAATAPEGRHLAAMRESGAVRALSLRISGLSTLSLPAPPEGEDAKEPPPLPALPPPHVAAVWLDTLSACLLGGGKEHMRELGRKKPVLDATFRITAEHAQNPHVQLAGLQVLAAMLPVSDSRWLVDKGLMNLLTQTLHNCGGYPAVRMLASNIAAALMGDSTARGRIPPEQLAQLIQVTQMLENPGAFDDDDDDPAASGAAGDQPAEAPAAAPPATAAAAADVADGDFEAAAEWQGSRPGWVFRKGPRGLGYYRDTPPQVAAAA